jgi:hypothetical protein
LITISRAGRHEMFIWKGMGVRTRKLSSLFKKKNIYQIWHILIILR